MAVPASLEPTEISELGEIQGLVDRILGGEVFVMRQGLQKVGLFDELVELSLKGIQASVGEEVAANAGREGFDRIHEWVDPGDLPRMTEAVYEVMEARAHTMMEKFVANVFPGEGSFYYERSPNVRFHIPYALAASHKQGFNEFAGSHGQGKITAHGPHRDSWVDCPDNVVNIWIAIGPVQCGNGLTVYADDYRHKVSFKDGYIMDVHRLKKPMTFDLAPGDAILFHCDHIHGSELNITDSTRYAVSNRVTFGKPHFPNGHHHHYVHAGLAGGPLKSLAGIPANLQMSYVADRFRRLARKLGFVKSGISEQVSSGNEAGGTVDDVPTPKYPVEGGFVAVEDLPVGEILPLSKTTCVARLGENEFVGFGRRCPHSGGDLANGWILDGRPVCPLHNLSFDPKTGESDCSALKSLQVHELSVRDGRIYSEATRGAGSAEASNPA